MVERLREKKMDVETLDGLCEKLATSSVDWVKNFIKFGGVAWLYECLAFYVYKAGYAHSPATRATTRPHAQHERRTLLTVACRVVRVVRCNPIQVYPKAEEGCGDT